MRLIVASTISYCLGPWARPISNAIFPVSSDTHAWLCHDHNGNGLPRSLWISRASGEDFHLIGTEPRLDDPMLTMYDLQWQPDAHHLSLAYDNHLYSVSLTP